jgi:hypothetical protein
VDAYVEGEEEDIEDGRERRRSVRSARADFEFYWRYPTRCHYRTSHHPPNHFSIM